MEMAFKDAGQCDERSRYIIMACFRHNDYQEGIFDEQEV